MGGKITVSPQSFSMCWPKTLKAMNTSAKYQLFYRVRLSCGYFHERTVEFHVKHGIRRCYLSPPPELSYMSWQQVEIWSVSQFFVWFRFMDARYDFEQFSDARKFFFLWKSLCPLHLWFFLLTFQATPVSAVGPGLFEIDKNEWFSFNYLIFEETEQISISEMWVRF